MGDLELDLTGDKLIALAFPFDLEDWLDSLKAFDLERVARLASFLAWSAADGFFFFDGSGAKIRGVASPFSAFRCERRGGSVTTGLPSVENSSGSDSSGRVELDPLGRLTC
jgi:hypothetical protein